jgi:DNA-binding SARP family transcriptional activator
MEAMPRPDSFALIDTLRDGSVSFAPPDPSDPDASGAASDGWTSAQVGAGRLVSTPALLGGASRDGVSGYPIQVGKVQRPPLRDETLARHRLLDWLDVKIHNRVVFVIADAGYGKTTLLADFSRRTRLRTLWYRMDEEDRNWVTFLSYLVAAGREHDPEFAPRTYALLQDTGPGGAGRDEVTAAFMRELPDIAPTPTVLILDDFHVADGSGDVAYVAKMLVTKAPERLSIVVSSRLAPDMALGRLRAQGEVAELRNRDLQFSEREIADLFDSHLDHPLDRESIGLLNRRSEGWAASLQLIGTALRDRTALETREFIRSLSGDQAELYDYLAEEVVGDLPTSHQEFLMRTSLLQAVTVASGAAICGKPTSAIEAMVEQSERLGLLGRQGSVSAGFRYHPLVREFLEGRLRANIGDTGIRALHEEAGIWAEAVDWRPACYHYEAAHNISSLHRVLDSAIDSIAGQGRYEVAADYLRRYEPSGPRASFEIVASRVEFQRGNFDTALNHANRAVALEPGSDAALSNSITMHGHVGNLEQSWELAKQLAATAGSPLYRSIAQARCLMYEASLDGPLSNGIAYLSDLALRSEADRLTHFAGVSRLNIAILEQARGDSDAAYLNADQAIVALGNAYEGAELASAYLARAAALAYRGSIAEARADIRAAADAAPAASRGEWLVEAAEIEVGFGSDNLAESLLAEARSAPMTPSIRRYSHTIETRLLLRRRNSNGARALATTFEVGKGSDLPALKSRQLALAAHAAFASGDGGARRLIDEAEHHAEAQGSLLWLRYCQMLKAVRGQDSGKRLSSLMERIPANESWSLDAFAEDVCFGLADLDQAARDRVERQCASRRERWLPALRVVVASPGAGSRWMAGEILDVVGETEDIATLRALARSSKGTQARTALGKSLARRLAPRFVVEDLGRVEVRSENDVVPTASIRRKVLAMLCYLLTRPRFSATRDEVIDALWPDLAPDVAVNSLNQTVYFLRRVFEPHYAEDLSAGYVHHNSDMLWLDQELVTSRSALCREILDSIGAEPDPMAVMQVSIEYTDRFALDFAYEEWAVPYRTSLHAKYLRVVESAVRSDMASGHHDRAIEIARRALDRDADVESLELALLRLYRTTGAHAAAAEQYAHYAAVLKEELGIDPPPLASI